MKTFKKSKVVMLPDTIKSSYPELWLMHNKSQGLMHLKTATELDGVGQHLYFLSDEEIKEGDWMFHMLDEKPSRWNGEEINPSVYGYKKIVAATDRSLCYLLEPHKDQFGDMRYNKFHELPQPSQEFIKHYVEEYNKGNVITEVLIEYEKWTGKNYVGEFSTDQDFNYKLKINPNNIITIQKLKQQFPREEVIHLLRLAFDAGKHEAVKVNEWIDETLNY